jgi:hypothetical protein
VGDVISTTFHRVVVPGLTQDEQDAFDANLKRLLDHRRRNFARSCLYDGKNAMLSKSNVVPEQYYKLGLALGWSAKAVDALIRRTRFERMMWNDGDLDSIGMREFARDNQLRSQIGQSLTDSALHGVSFLINTQGDDGEPRSLLHVRDALNATGTMNTRVHRLEDGLSVTKWNDEDDKKPDEFTLYLDGLTITAVREDGKWTVEHSEHPWGVPVEPLIYRPRPSRRYGQSRLTRPIIGLHMAAVRELIRGEGHMDVYSYPEFWMLGGDMSAFKNADGSQKAVWQVMLGRIKGIQDDPSKPDDLARADVKHFPAASPEPHAKWLDVLSRAFAREASLPDSAVALEGLSNPTSADAYDASQYELIAEAEGATEVDWPTPLTRSVARGLAILNGESSIPDEWLSIKPEWLGAKFESRAAKADAGSKQLAAVPWLAETEIGLELLGLTPDQIERAMTEKRRAAGRAVLAALAPQAQPAPQADANGA